MCASMSVVGLGAQVGTPVAIDGGPVRWQGRRATERGLRQLLLAHGGGQPWVPEVRSATAVSPARALSRCLRSGSQRSRLESDLWRKPVKPKTQPSPPTLSEQLFGPAGSQKKLGPGGSLVSRRQPTNLPAAAPARAGACSRRSHTLDGAPPRRAAQDKRADASWKQQPHRRTSARRNTTAAATPAGSHASFRDLKNTRRRRHGAALFRIRSTISASPATAPAAPSSLARRYHATTTYWSWAGIWWWSSRGRSRPTSGCSRRHSSHSERVTAHGGPRPSRPYPRRPETPCRCYAVNHADAALLKAAGGFDVAPLRLRCFGGGSR